MARDVVCGMAVSESGAKKSTHKGKTYLFCSAACKTLFDKNPKKYV